MDLPGNQGLEGGLLDESRELRLRQRIDVLTSQRDHARARAVKRRRTSYLAHCVYCGVKVKSHGRPATCRCHRDLVAIDPFYSALLEAVA